MGGSPESIWMTWWGEIPPWLGKTTQQKHQSGETEVLNPQKNHWFSECFWALKMSQHWGLQDDQAPGSPPGAQPVRISVGQDEHGSLSDQKSHVRHARDGIVQTVKVVDFPDDYEKQVAEKRKLLDNYLQGALNVGLDHVGWCWMKSDRGIQLAGRSLLDSQLMFLPRIAMICWVMLSFFMGPVIITPGFSLRFFPSSQMKIRVQQWSNPAICAWFIMESLYFYISIFPILSHILSHVSGTFSIFQPYFSHFSRSSAIFQEFCGTVQSTRCWSSCPRNNMPTSWPQNSGTRASKPPPCTAERARTEDLSPMGICYVPSGYD